MGRIIVEHVCNGGCGGSGVYAGCAEPKGVAVVCLACDGTGKQTSYFEPFVKRRQRKGIHWVQRSKGSFIMTGVGPMKNRITYPEFLNGKMPKEDRK